MQKPVMRWWHQLIGCALVLFLTAGCFQAAGEAPFEPTNVAQIAPTYTPIPSDTPVPTEIPTETPEPTITLTGFPSLTPRADVTRPVSVSSLGSETPTNTATPSPTSTNTATATQSIIGGGSNLETPQSSPVEIVQLPTLDPINQTATAFYAQPPAGQPIVPTTDPLTVPIQEDPNILTATAIIEQATQTASAPLTQQAILTGGSPTPTATTQPPVGATAQPQVATPVIPSGTDCIHEVRATDRNLYRIALNYGLTVQQIATASGIVNPDLILVGQRLTIPGCGTTGARPLATSTPISTNTPVGPTAVPAMTFTPIPDGSIPTGGQPTTGGTTTGAGGVHVVQQGETLFQLSMRYGPTVHEIAAANGISNLNLIYIGQELVIP